MEISQFKSANKLIREKKYEEAAELLEDLIKIRPDFIEYYVSLVYARKSLPKEFISFATDSLAKKEFAKLINFSESVEGSIKLVQSSLIKRYSGLTFSFCIPVKNRSKVKVCWDGTHKSKTFITSYKNSPKFFELNLLKNCIKSIVESAIKGVKFEIIIVDFVGKKKKI